MKWIIRRLIALVTNTILESAFDPKHNYYDAKSKREKPMWYNVHVEFKQKFDKLIPLPDLKSHSEGNGPLSKMELFRLGRLSVCEVAPEEWDFIMGLAGLPSGRQEVEKALKQSGASPGAQDDAAVEAQLENETESAIEAAEQAAEPFTSDPDFDDAQEIIEQVQSMNNIADEIEEMGEELAEKVATTFVTNMGESLQEAFDAIDGPEDTVHVSETVEVPIPTIETPAVAAENSNTPITNGGVLSTTVPVSSRRSTSRALSAKPIAPPTR